MADDLSLIFRVRGDASGAKQATADTRTAVAQLRTQITSDSKAIATAGQVGAKGTQSLALSLQTVQSSLQSIGGPIGAFSGQIVNASSMLSGFSGEAAGLAGPAGLAVVAIAAMTAATVGLAKQIFDLTVKTAEWQGKMFDLSQQTGVAVETLSALEVGAATTGGSIDAISQSLFQFQRKLEDARDPTSKEAELLKALGVQTNNTEQALRQSFTALSQMTDKIKQTDAAATLFGARGGKQVLAILKEWNGDIDGTIAGLRAMGILIDTDTAKAADKFNDQLTMLHFQLRGVVALVGREAMPTILNAVERVSKALVDNRQIISQWATSIGDAGRGALILGGYLARLGGIITGLGNIPIPMIIRILGSISGATGILTGLAGIGAANRGPQVGGTATLGAGLTPGVGRIPSIGGGGRGGGGADRISEGQRLLNQLTDEYNRLQEKANELTKVKIVALEILDAKYKNLSPTLRDQIFQQAALIDQAREQADSDKRKAEATEKIRALLERQTQAIRDARIGEEQWTDQIVKLEAELKKLGLTMDDNTRKLLLDNAATQQALALTRERIVLEQTRIDRMERDRLATPERKQEQLEREQGIFRSEGDEERQRRVAGEVDQSRSAIDQLFGAIDENLSGAQQTAALAGLEALTGAFQGLGQAVGAVVEAWVLYGSAGTSVRKVTAQILAGVAQQAAVKAVFELAEGFAALALAFFGMPNAGPSASAHFTAAAIYGSIAAVAAVAGRAVAGDSFKKSAETGGGSGSSRSGGSSGGQSGKPETMDVNRNALAQPTGTLTINLGLKDGVIADGFKKDYLLNGVTRLVIKTDGQG